MLRTASAIAAERIQANMTAIARIAVIGLGYVGLPVATGFARRGYTVLGFDIDRRRLDELAAGLDRTGEVEPDALRRPELRFTAEVADLATADCFIVTVPTPIDDAKRPDLRALLSASETVGRALRPGAYVIYESTVYPGATEDDCIPVLEAASGLTAGRDFFVGYSPERINPGDPTHRLETVVKIVSAQTPEALDVIAALYGSVVTAGVHRAPSIRVAEAAKVIENTQRDLNIAFVNELAQIFRSLGLDTGDVLRAASTKWNFLPFHPGLVGGHCIGVDPYYLTHRAQRAGHHPDVILAGRRTNDGMGTYVAHQCLRLLLSRGGGVRRVAVLGLTFKENVPDIRNSKVADIVSELGRFDVAVEVADPLADPQDALRQFGITLVAVDALATADAVILAVPHRTLQDQGWPLITRLLKPVDGLVLDLKGVLDRSAVPTGVTLWRL